MSGHGTTTTIKALAVKEGMTNSEISSAEYTINYEKVSTPNISPTDETYNKSVEITISCLTDDSKIYYTINGTDPTSTSTEYTTPFTITATKTVKAIAYKDGMLVSDISSSLFALTQINYVTVTGAGLKDGSSWSNAYDDLSLQTAISESGIEEVWVAEGTYYPTVEVGGVGERYKTFQLKNGVAVYGGFVGTETSLNQRDAEVHITNLSGDIDLDDTLNDGNAYHVFYHPDGTDLDATAVLDGFGVMLGNANIDYSFNSGGGMYNYGSGPTINNCMFSNNNASAVGGAIANIGISNIVLNDTMFIQNNADSNGGAIYNWTSAPQISNCIFNTNTSDELTGLGGAIYNNGSNSIITSSSFVFNSAKDGGAIYNVLESNIEILASTFESNGASFFGGVIYNDDSIISIVLSEFTQNRADNSSGCLFSLNGDVVIINSLFDNNTAGTGACLTFSGVGVSEIINSTLSKNVAVGNAGAIFNSSSLDITNSIIWGNVSGGQGNQIYNNGGGTINMYYSCYSNEDNDIVDLGTIIIDVNSTEDDPIFVDADNDDFGLSDSESPAVDSGLNSAIVDIGVDLDVNPRIVHTTVDMGAYEYQGPF